MNIDTGELKCFATDSELSDFMNRLSSTEREKWAPVKGELTTKQIKKMRVSLNDTRSPVGKELAALRKIRRKAKKMQARKSAAIKEDPDA